MDGTAATLGTAEATPVGDPRITAYGMLLEAHAALGALVARDLDEVAGLPMSWFEVLVRLSRSPDERLRMRDLAGQVLFSTSGLTRLVDRMERAGLVRREQCPDDRRGSFAVLTEEGHGALDATLPRHLRTLDEHLVEPLGEEALDQLTASLEILRDHAHRVMGTAIPEVGG